MEDIVRTGEQYGRHRKKAGSFLAPRILCETILSGVWEEPLKGNRRGSPGCFCSNRCRWAFNKRMEREDSNAKNNTGDGTETGSLQPEKETEAG